MSDIAPVAELETFLAAHPDIEAFDVIFTPLSGVPRGKRLRRSELMAVYRQGRFLPTSLLAVDIRGEDCYETGLVWEDGDSDRSGFPVSGRITPTPWHGPDMGQVLLSLYDLNGKPNPYDPRHVLKRVMDRYARDGLKSVLACELEFYLLKPGRGPDGELIPADEGGIEVYGLPQLAARADFLRDLWKGADAAGLPLEGAISENAPGQVELTLHHKDDALAACDDAILYKMMTKAIARKHGFDATFMARPFNQLAGSGCHIHLSLNDAKGDNLCASEGPEGSEALRHMIGGMKALMGESMAFFAPNANSYKRFRANSYAPVAPNWGVNNRTVALRVAAGPPANRHVEHRIAGADVNPYLAVAAMLSAAHWGLKQRIDPDAPVKGNGYEAEAPYRLPGSWVDALGALGRSEVLKDYLGADFVSLYIAQKTVELQRFFDPVTPHDHEWYLHNV